MTSPAPVEREDRRRPLDVDALERQITAACRKAKRLQTDEELEMLWRAPAFGSFETHGPVGPAGTIDLMRQASESRALLMQGKRVAWLYDRHPVTGRFCMYPVEDTRGAEQQLPLFAAPALPNEEKAA